MDEFTRIIADGLALQTQLRLEHWETESYSRHLTFEWLQDELRKDLDDFVEQLVGVYEASPQDILKSVYMAEYNHSDRDDIMEVMSMFQYDLKQLPVQGLLTLSQARDKLLATVNHGFYKLHLN